jgi:hypothetical protein
VATLVTASPAAAAITGRTIVSATTPTNLEATKQIFAGCPSGMVALGGGAVIVGGNGVVHLTADVPTVVNGHTAKAVAYPGFRDGVWVDAIPWRLTAHVICATGVTGREVVVGYDAIGEYETAGSVTVPCPAGKKVIGMGGWVGGQFILSSCSPRSP